MAVLFNRRLVVVSTGTLQLYADIAELTKYVNDFTAYRITGHNSLIYETSSFGVYTPSLEVEAGQTLTAHIFSARKTPDMLYWTVKYVTNTQASDFTEVSGTFSTTNYSYTLSFETESQASFEETKEFQLELRLDSITGEIVAESPVLTLNSIVTPYSITPDVSNVQEGQVVTFSVVTPVLPDNTTLYWSTTGTSVAADFSDNTLTGSCTVVSNTASIPRRLFNDLTAESNQTFQLQLRSGSVAGTLLATSTLVTVGDSFDYSTVATINTVTLTSPLGAITLAGNLWVSSSSGKVTKINLVSKSATTYTISPSTSGFSTDGISLFCAGYVGATHGWQKINPADGSVLEAYTTGGSTTLNCVYYNNHVYVSDASSTYSVTKSTLTGTVTASYALSGGAYGIWLQDNFIWACKVSGGVVVRLSENLDLQFSVSLGGTIYSGCFDGTHIWVGDYTNNVIKRLDKDNGNVINTYSGFTAPLKLVYDAVVGYLIVSGNGQLKLVNISDGAVAKTITVGSHPEGVAVAPDGKIYVCNYSSNTVQEVY